MAPKIVKPTKANKAKARKALVKWARGAENSKLHIIDLSWLKDFDEEKWKRTSEADRETEIAEWRVGKKNESGGWTVYDCRVLEISDSIKTLEAMKAELSAAEKNDNGEDSEDATSSEDIDDDDESDVSHSSELAAAPKSVKSGKAKRDPQALKALEKQNEKLLKLLGNKFGDDPPVSKKKKVLTEKVPLYPGSPYLVDKVAYDAAVNSKKFSTFVGDMLELLFPKHVSVVSNIGGGGSKVQLDKPLQKFALNKRKRLALTNAAMDLFKSTNPTVAQAHRAIQQKINNIRAACKKEGTLEELEKKGLEACKDMASASKDDGDEDDSTVS